MPTLPENLPEVAAAQVDKDVLELAQEAPNFQGTPDNTLSYLTPLDLYNIVPDLEVDFAWSLGFRGAEEEGAEAAQAAFCEAWKAKTGRTYTHPYRLSEETP